MPYEHTGQVSDKRPLALEKTSSSATSQRGLSWVTSVTAPTSAGRSSRPKQQQQQSHIYNLSNVQTPILKIFARRLKSESWTLHSQQCFAAAAAAANKADVYWQTQGYTFDLNRLELWKPHGIGLWEQTPAWSLILGNRRDWGFNLTRPTIRIM